MILIITHKCDFTVDFVVNKLNEKKISYHRFNCEDINLESAFSFSISGISNLKVGVADKYKSIWYRRIMLPRLGAEDTLSQAERNYIRQSYDSILQNIFTLLEGKWMSKPANIDRAESKLLQLKEASRIGFKTPVTLVTQSKEQIRLFYKQFNGNVIIKPIHSSKIDDTEKTKLFFANKINKQHLLELKSYTITPCIFQEFIDKECDIRATVVNNKVFSAYVDSQNEEATRIDWRRKKRKFKPYSLPVEVQEKCLALTRELGLSFGAIDIVKSRSGEYVFLEINPNGQWAWIEIDTGLRISDEIINYLNN